MRKELIAQKDPKSPVSEVFRTLRTNIQFMNAKGKLKTLLVTSTLPGEGKSWVASNLAVTFAQAGKNVILIDADMRKGRQYTIFGVSPIPGLSNYLSDVSSDEAIDYVDYIQETEVDNLYIMPAGNVPPNPSELLTSMEMVNLLEELKKISDIVIIDGTPCELVTDSVVISRIVDSTIIVTASKQTKKENLKRVIANIKNVGGNLAGVVLNKVPVSGKRYEQSYYYGSTSTNIRSNNMKKYNKNQKNMQNTQKNKINTRPAKNLRPTNSQYTTNQKSNVNIINKIPQSAENENIKRVEPNNQINKNNDIKQQENISVVKEYKIDTNNNIPQNNTEYNRQDNNVNTQFNKQDNNILRNNIQIQNQETISLEKTNEILQQINDYLDKEKKNLQ